MGILHKADISKKIAFFYIFLVATAAILGTVLALWFGHEIEHFSIYVLPIAAGGFIYLAASSLLPEILRNTRKGSWIFYSVFVLLGLGLMYFFSLSGGHQH